jgi:hypothetical protein
MAIREASPTEEKARVGYIVLFIKTKILLWNVRGLNERDKRF